MTARVVLSGTDWQVKAYYGEDWRWRDVHLPVHRDTRHWIPARVPGTIQHDVWQAGQIPDPYFEQNSLLAEWIPTRTWVYRKTFTLNDEHKGKRALLRFEGVDHEARFYLNGHLLGSHVGMATPAVFEVGQWLKFDGDNVLAVVLEPAPHEQPQIGRTSLIRTHKGRMSYWWDFCPRMVHLGLWDEVFLDFTGPVMIHDVFVRPQLSQDFQHAELSVEITLGSIERAVFTLETTIYENERVAASLRSDRHIEPGTAPVEIMLSIDQPKLWYPNGLGEQPLYRAEIRVLVDDNLFDQKMVRFGIRKIELIPNEHADPTALPYTLVVNGQPTYINGWNWVPIDVMYGVRQPEKLERLLTLAQRAHVNLLRIWGGGTIEKKAFYNRCDELGILVWQEFLLSSSGIDNNPPSDAHFIALMVREAEQIIPRKRNHPSLALWCGGNELTDGETNGDVKPLDDGHPLLAALKATVQRLDPDRLWLPTSPTGPVFSNSLTNIDHDPMMLHDTHGPWEYQGVEAQYTLYNRGSSLLHSEFGVEGITNLKTLNATISPEHQQPVSLDNPLWQHLGAWWVKRPVWDKTFGELTAPELLVRATQFMQASGLQYALEADGRRRYQCSGTLPWQFNEPYPMAACTSAVDYYGNPKPVYYAVAGAYEPLHLSARFDRIAWAGHETFEAEVWINSALPHEIPGVYFQAHLHNLLGQIVGEWTTSVHIATNAAASVLTFALPSEQISTDVFFLDLTARNAANDMIAANRYVFTKADNLAPLLAVPSTTLTAEWNTTGLTIRNTGQTTALFVWLEDDRSVGSPGNVYFSNNYFCLLPGEVRPIVVEWNSVIPANRRITLKGWNTNTLIFEEG